MSSKNPRKTRSFGSGKKAVKKFKVGGTSATPISAREAAMLRAINNLIASQGSTRGGPTMRGRVVANPSGITRLGPLKLDRRSPFEKSLSPAQARIYNRMIEERDSGPFVDSMNRNFPVEAQLAKQYLGAPAGGGFGTVPAGTPGSGDSLNAIRDAQSAAAVQQLRDAANARAMAAAQQAAAAKNTYNVIPQDLAGNPLPTFDQPGGSGSGFRGPSSSAFSYGSRLPAVNPPPSTTTAAKNPYKITPTDLAGNPLPTPDSGVTVAPISSGEEDMDVDPIYRPDAMEELGLYRGGRARSVKRYASGGSVRSSASKRGDGIARKGKTRGKFV